MYSVLHLFLRLSQSLVRESPSNFPTRGTPWNAEPSFSHAAQTQGGAITDGEAESELGDYLAANVTAWSFPGVRAVQMPPRRVNNCISASSPFRLYAGR